MGSDVYLEGRFFGEPGSWFIGRDLVKTLRADSFDEVPGVIEDLEAAATDGLTCAGFLTYEAFGGLDVAQRSPRASRAPLAWFQCFRSFELVPDPFACDPSTPRIWRSSVTEEEFFQSFAVIKRYMAAGDTYQVNYTFRLRSCECDGKALMARLVDAQPDSFGAYFDTGEQVVCSVSPELFLTIDGEDLVTRPMKGTRPRGRTQETDEAFIHDLTTSEKERAENLMIVDMARNDLGRIAEVGSVHVPNLFAVETYKTLHQLTSEVRARSNASLLEIFAATFPPASITGAPKVRTMEIIDELETSRRGVYTGCIGVFGPGRKGAFSVAIRTAVIDKSSGTAEYGVGAGIVWDSDAGSEWEESLLKGAVLGALDGETKLIETLRYQRPDGYFLLERHLDRLSSSSASLGFVCDRASVVNALSDLDCEMDDGGYKVRLLLSPSGEIELHNSKIEETGGTARVAVLENSVDSSDPLLRHKTTRRAVFETARAKFPDCDEVILTNERGEVTEGCTTNVLVEIDGFWYTPPVSCGLLPGTLRGELIDTGAIQERVLTLQDLERAEHVQIVNSVRGRRTAVLVHATSRV